MMVKPRITETDQGITGPFNTRAYDQMMRRLRDKGWMETNLIIKEGISAGRGLEDEHFDAVFSNGSLHEWAQPAEILNEIARVLKPGGRYLISDLRRDTNPIMKWFLGIVTGPREMRSGLVSSINGSYTLPDAEGLLRQTKLQGWGAKKNFLGIVISARKPV